MCERASASGKVKSANRGRKRFGDARVIRRPICHRVLGIGGVPKLIRGRGGSGGKGA